MQIAKRRAALDRQSADSSVAPMRWPGRTPPPASQMVKPAAVVIAAVVALHHAACGRTRWPRSTSVSSSRPRCFRSASSAAIG